MSYVDKCSWCTTPYTVRRGRRPRRRWSRRTASCCCTTCTLSCCWCIRCRWFSWHTVSGTAWHCGWLRNVLKLSLRPLEYECTDVQHGCLSGSQTPSGGALPDLLLDFGKQDVTISREQKICFHLLMLQIKKVT